MQTATAIATFTPTSTATATAFPTEIPVTPVPEVTPEPEIENQPFLWWQLLGLLGLMLVIASTSVVDPRPQALRCLAESFKQISSSNYLDLNQGEE